MFIAAMQVWVAEQVLHAPVQSLFWQHPPIGMQVTLVPEVHDCMLAGQE